MTIAREPQTERTEEQTLFMSYDEFLQLPDYLHAEWVDGEVTIFMPPTTRHQEVLRFISELMSLFVQHFRLGTVLFAPLEMRIRQGRSGREPDLLFIASEHFDRLTPQRLEGPADLVVELISPESVERDQVTKLKEYEEAGVQEYWLIDPRPAYNSATFYQLNDQGQYKAVLPDAQGCYHSRVLSGFWLQVAWLWQPELPFTLDALREIVGSETL